MTLGSRRDVGIEAEGLLQGSPGFWPGPWKQRCGCLLWRQETLREAGVHGRLRSSGHSQSEVPMALPLGKVQDTGEYVAGAREGKASSVSNQVLTQNTAQGKAD